AKMVYDTEHMEKFFKSLMQRSSTKPSGFFISIGLSLVLICGSSYNVNIESMLFKQNWRVLRLESYE
ncbi:MAG: hypothetical protein ACQ9MH_22820, partial [Nitrospinales bacterium]